MAEREEKRQTGIRLPKEVRIKLGIVGVERGLSLNQLISLGMSEWYNLQPEAKTHGLLPQYLPEKRGAKKKA